MSDPEMRIRTAARGAGFEFALDAGAHAPADARQQLQLRLPGGLPADLVDDLLLLATELVTNSVRHSPAGLEGGIGVAVVLAPDRIRVEVSDPGTGFRHVRHQPGTLSEGGRGLFLVEAISDAWGMGEGPGTTVWFELAIDRYEPPPAATSEDQLVSDTAGLAAELRALGSETRSLEGRARDIEADLSRVAENLRAGAEALRSREKVADPHEGPDPAPQDPEAPAAAG
jgi:anti-sigma regulatory factor (Ser/Thr protein kinase)